MSERVEAAPWKCPSCFREGVPEVVQILQGERYTPEAKWVDSSIRRCPDGECKHTFGGSLSDRLAHIRSVYGYKYFGDYELSAEQLDAVYEARAIAALVPDLLEALKLLLADVADYPAWQRPCHAVDVAVEAIAKAEGATP